MANVLLSTYSNVTWTHVRYHDSFIQGFINALKRNGNNVMVVRTNEFLTDQISATPRTWMDTVKITQRVQAFKPDLILTFNNSLPCPQVIESTTCPVLVYASDAPSFFVAKHLIQKHQERYYFLDLTEKVTAALKHEFPYIKPSHYIPFGHATDLRATDIPQDIDLSFVGSIGNYSQGVIDYFKNFDSLGNTPSSLNPNILKDEFFQALDLFQENSMEEFEFDFPHASHPLKNISPQILLMLTCKLRFETLSQLTDLGLKIFGYPTSWAQVLQYNHQLFRCFDYTLNVSLEHSTNTYNRSKVSLNLPHGQTTDGFSWRVCEILASNAVLLSNRKQDLLNLMHGYADLPTYTSPAEARDLAQKLLADPALRRDLSLASQQMINDKCRFEAKFQTIQSAIGNLTLLSAQEGSFSTLEETDCLHEGRYLLRALRHRQYLRPALGRLKRRLKQGLQPDFPLH